MGCASRTINGTTSGSCSGDSGAPLIDMSNGKLSGIVTLKFVSVCDNEDYPDVYTSLNYYKNWIESYIDKFSCPFFDTMKYPTSSPTFSIQPSHSPSSLLTDPPSVSIQPSRSSSPSSMYLFTFPLI